MREGEGREGQGGEQGKERARQGKERGGKEKGSLRDLIRWLGFKGKMKWGNGVYRNI